MQDGLFRMVTSGLAPVRQCSWLSLAYLPLMPLVPIPGNGKGYGRKMPGETVKRGGKTESLLPCLSVSP